MSIRSEAEIEKMFEVLGIDEDEAPIHWKGDNFRYGLFIGKAIALAWVLGAESTEHMNVNKTFEEWEKEAPDNVNRPLSGE